jgi:hypothetical protein
MSDPTRVDIMGGGTILSLPVRLPLVFVPHAVLLAVIVLASMTDMVLSLANWIGL